MDPRILDIKRRAKEISSARPQTAFSTECAEELRHASNLFFDHPLMLRLQGDAIGFLNDVCGFGVAHGKRVAIDAAAIVLAEPCGLSPDERRRTALLAAMAGLLHDAMNHEDEHPERGADLCMRLLRGYALTPEERVWIAQAVALHEADLPLAEAGPEAAHLVCGAVHDADRFRFGPDIFAATMWEYCDCDEWPLEEIAQAFAKGADKAASCARGFRTEIGRRYGPALLDEGQALARRYADMIRERLAAGVPSNT